MSLRHGGHCIALFFMFTRDRNTLHHRCLIKNTYIRNCYYIESEAEIIAVKIQDFKRIPTS